MGSGWSAFRGQRMWNAWAAISSSLRTSQRKDHQPRPITGDQYNQRREQRWVRNGIPCWEFTWAGTDRFPYLSTEVALAGAGFQISRRDCEQKQKTGVP